MGGSAGKSESQANNAFEQNVWNPQAQMNMQQGFQNSYDQNQFGMGERVEGVAGQNQGVFDAANPAWQQQLQGGAYAGMDLQRDYNNALRGGGNEQFMNQSIMGGAGNNYVDAMKGQMQQDSDTRLGQSLAGNDLRAVGAGQSGSSRHGITERGIRDQSEQNLGRMQTQMGFDTFDKDLDRKLGIAQRADQFDMGRLQQSGQMLGNQQGVMQGAINQGSQMQNLGMGSMAPYMAPGSMNQQHANAMGGPTILGRGYGDSSSKGMGGGGGVGGGK